MSLLTENLMNQLHHLKPSINKEQLQSAYSWGNAKIVGCRGNCSGNCGYGCAGSCAERCVACCADGCILNCVGSCAGRAH